jgi:hypothetical protein
LLPYIYVESMMNGTLRVDNIIFHPALLERTVLQGSKILLLMLTASGLAATAAAGTLIVSNTTQGAVAAAISSACNGSSPGTVVFPTGTYSITASITVPAQCTLTNQTGATPVLNNSSGDYAFNGSGDHITIQGLTFQGSGGIGLGLTQPSGAIESYVTISGNTFRNINNGQDGIELGPISVHLVISNNTFTNIAQGGYGSLTISNFADIPGNGITVFNGMDQGLITGNTFDQISGDGMHVFYGGVIGATSSYTSAANNEISYNTFTRVHRIPIEAQATSGNCPGGCASTNALAHRIHDNTIKGNYARSNGISYYQTWGYSLVVDHSLNPTILNNTAIFDTPNCPGGGPAAAAAMENDGDNSIVQGNVLAVSTTACSASGTIGHGWNGMMVTGTIGGGYTVTHQNNLICGPNTIAFQNEQWNNQNNPGLGLGNSVDQYNYATNNLACPNAVSPATSNISAAYSASNSQSFPSGGNGTWSVSVISNLSIRYVRFFLDGSIAPISTQEIQDLNTNFAQDRKWLYHVAINTSALTTGTHLLSAVVTDVSGATQTVTQNFTTKGTIGGGAPVASVSPASLSFSATTVGQTTPAQSVMLTNSGTAPLSVGTLTVGGANASDFSQSSQCGSSLEVGSSCGTQVVFNPTAAGSRTATLVMTDNAAGSPRSVVLTGTGNALAIAPTPPPTAATLPSNLPKGMILWLANNAGVVANGSKVSAWDDQSGNGDNAVQPNAANQPTVVPGNNGQSALRFDGSSSFMSLPSLPIDGSTGLTVMLVSANLIDQPAGYGWYAFLLWPETAEWGSTFFGTYQTTSHFRFGTMQAGNEPEYTMPFSRTNSYGLSEWLHAGATDSMWFNSEAAGTFTGKFPSIAGIGNSAVLGRGLDNTFYSGDIAELIVYSRSLTAAERQTVEQYLMKKYHL